MSKKNKSASERKGGISPKIYNDPETFAGLSQAIKSVSKPLVVTPQVIVALHPDGSLSIERPTGGQSYRHKTVLTRENIYNEIMGILQEKAGEIELERQLAEERRNAPARKRAQPNWRLIAKHAQAEIRQGLTDASLCAKGSITVCPSGPGLTATKSAKTLEEMDL